MTLSLPADAARVFFPDLDLGDARRDRRFRAVVGALAANPGASLPEFVPARSDSQVCLNLFDSPQCTHAAILEAHQVATLDAMERHAGEVLILHDGTCLDFSGHTTLDDELGEIGNGGGLGWVAHQSLAVNPANRTVFGRVGQILHVRETVAKGESVAAKRDRTSRESRLWLRALDEIGPTPAGATWVHVGDRGADVFEFLQPLADRDRSFVVRSTHNRAVGAGPRDAKADALLHDRLRAGPAPSHWELKIPTKAGHAGRTARLSAAAIRVELRPPHVKKGHSRDEPVTVNAVRVGEADPPAGVVQLEWILLTSEAVDTLDQLRTIADGYACRTQIEEFHKVQKSGTRVEGCQVQSAQKIAAFVAVLSVVAVGLMNLLLTVRDPAAAARPAETVVPAVWVEVLSRTQLGRPKAWTAGEFWVHLARLGGYHKNPATHPPGWITLGRGWAALHPLVRYHNLSRPEMA